MMGRADVMFVIQRVLEVDGKLTLLDTNKVIHPNAILDYLRLQIQLVSVIQALSRHSANKPRPDG